MDVQILSLMLCDSGLPVGGFVSSGGLEAALQLRLTSRTSEALCVFIHAAMHSTRTSTLPFVRAGMFTQKSPGTQKPPTSTTVALDRLFHTHLGLNASASRASAAQGIAYLTFISACFPNLAQAAVEFKHLALLESTHAHLPISFAIVCSSLGLSTSQACEIYMFQQARMLVSSAVRLNIVGPYLGQTVLYECLKKWADVSLENKQPQSANECDYKYSNIKNDNESNNENSNMMFNESRVVGPDGAQNGQPHIGNCVFDGNENDRHDIKNIPETYDNHTDYDSEDRKYEMQLQWDIIDRELNLPSVRYAQTSPFIDMAQGLHYRLHSRMFNS